ncbi:tyrosine--tRNA ligase [Taylorella equigenitalis]|uniref:Tyrosine--tRNA ligase n=3 Tax=Taylorella equigenitalis TaxID=29575 RepID=A0A654KHK4_TAYEM|nr:tyrosine--tRNA ligase [Taylorella equigenitalis]ADU91336.1 Tyrosyl-tRNA synthetase [Taylorella equigenitalis MCE9]AFN36431.1 tyrosyl-tRNA synthetase [Taylorella equigenitalis ATCC 35865]ASY31000.1 tyrosine--tRNA ligase [Taylorella equigenitalis]ASY38303.1 tyrosine--tRNA ligase [Taylorella equigenitalis]ASY39832.1 tyrosine--tRNA ligase [Taylorella equigenitalis]
MTSEVKISTEVARQMDIVRRGTDEILVESEFLEKLQKSHDSGTPLRIKLGLDPTAPDLHLGHTVVLTKMRQLQDMGHEVIFLIGDFTATIGDPSGRNATRPPLTKEQIEVNAQTYYDQASKVLDPSKTVISYNSKWCDALGARGLIELASKYTVARIMERDDFTKRFKGGIPISMHEILYPLMQGYDSVALKSDMELGGTDQKFNLLVGRELQKEYGQPQQTVLTMPLLVGLDGVEKMSKSKNNYIGITETPDSMFGKIMSISDSLMWNYYELISSKSLDEIKKLKQDVEDGINPRNIKVALAQEIITRFHNSQAAEKALADFELRFRDGQIPEDIPEVTLPGPEMGIVSVLRESGLAVSGSEASRNIVQGGVKVDGSKVEDKGLILKSGTYVVQIGKRKFARITIG